MMRYYCYYYPLNAQCWQLIGLKQFVRFPRKMSEPVKVCAETKPAVAAGFQNLLAVATLTVCRQVESAVAAKATYIL